MDGEQLLKYRGELERVLSVCVRVRCKRAYALACGLLEHSLRSLSLIYPTEYRSTAGGFHTELPIRVNEVQARFSGAVATVLADPVQRSLVTGKLCLLIRKNYEEELRPEKVPVSEEARENSSGLTVEMFCMSFMLEGSLMLISLAQALELQRRNHRARTIWPKLAVRVLFQDWGRAGDVAALGVHWHVPSREEEDFVFQLLSRLLQPELQRIQAHVSGDQPMSRWVQFPQNQ